MAQGVEIGIEGTIRPFDRVGDAGRGEVASEHGGGLLVRCPRSAPDGHPGRLALQVGSQQIGHVGGQGLHLQLAALVLPRSKGDGRVLAQVEVIRGQGGQPAGPEAGPACRGVEVEAIITGQSPEGVVFAGREVQRRADPKVQRSGSR
jgi:hypothetical protein